ncbi:MAG: tRNA (guanosine(46)-N7)-methyltransferase TrmB [Actinomycetaceae bacterium]|nr:tRNA (guanosine(46)-N7)-methyltransferase TrmB [Actinomycetaceae bacterium]
MVRQHQGVLDAHGSRYILDLPEGDSPTTIAQDARCDLSEAFGRQAPLVVEIGPGSGEQLVAYAKAHPERDILAFEAWHVAIARCVAGAVRAGVDNIRLVEADAAQALAVIFGHQANARVAEVWTFFPDPWRKSRHRKRRLVTRAFASDVATVLAPGGLWRLATDWDDYAWQMRDEIEASEFFDNEHAGQRPDPQDPQPDRGGFAPRWQERIMTRFESRGIEAGRTVHDLVFRRRG